jgi:hypothetical protein
MKLAFLLVVIYGCYALGPGLNIAITNQGLENLKTSLLPLALSSVTDLNIPNFSVSVGSSLLSIKFKFKEIDLTQFKLSLPDTKLTPIPTHEFKLSTKNLKAKGKCEIDYDSSLGDGDGKASMSISDTDVTVYFKVYTLGGVMNIQSVDASVDIGDLDVDISGDFADKVLDWLEDVFDSQVKDEIEDALEDKIEDDLTDYLNNLFKQYGPIHEFYGALGVNYNLLFDPIVNDGWFGLKTLGMIYDAYNSNYPPFDPLPSMTIYNSTGREMQIFLSSYTINTFLYTIYSYDIFQGNFTSEIMPNSSPIQLNTTSLDLVFPGLVEKYGDNLPVDVIFNLSNYTLIYNYAGLYGNPPYFKLDAPVHISLSVRGQPVYPVVFDSEVRIDASWGLEKWKFFGNINSFYLSKLDTLSYLLPNSINSETIRTIFNTIIKGIIPEINAKHLIPGIQLPEIPYLNLTDANIIIQNGYLYIDANPVFLVAKEQEEPNLDFI